MADIVYVCPSSFDGSKTREMALEIGEMNRRLLQENKPFLLIGPGRWGSADPWLGIPVQRSKTSWASVEFDISHVISEQQLLLCSDMFR